MVTEERKSILWRNFDFAKLCLDCRTLLARYQFHQHLTSGFFLQKSFAKLLCALSLQFVFEIFCSKRNNTKAACKMLVKLPSVVNFINILRAHFCRYFVTKNLQSQTLLEKSCSICFCTKKVRVKC